MFPIWQLGPLALQVPGLVLLLGVWLALLLAEKEAVRVSRASGLHAEGDVPQAAAGPVSPDAVYNLALVAIIAGLLGARLAYAARYLSAYLADPLGLLALNPATLAVPEGLLIGLVAALIYGSRRRLPLRLVLDAFAPALAIFGVALALAHLASGDAFGAPTRVPWRIYLWDDYRHPSQVYELLAALGVLGAWWWRRRRQDPLTAGDGTSFLFVVALTAGARLFLESFRGDSLLLAGGLRAAQVYALLVLALCLILLPHWRTQARTPGRAASAPGV